MGGLKKAWVISVVVLAVAVALGVALDTRSEERADLRPAGGRGDPALVVDDPRSTSTVVAAPEPVADGGAPSATVPMHPDGSVKSRTSRRSDPAAELQGSSTARSVPVLPPNPEPSVNSSRPIPANPAPTTTLVRSAPTTVASPPSTAPTEAAAPNPGENPWIPEPTAVRRRTDVESTLFTLHNQHRAQAGVAPLTRSGCLDGISDEWVRKLIAQDYTVHRSGPDMLARTKGCMTASQARENYAKVMPGDAQWLMRGWMESDGHRRTILEPAMTAVGISVWEDSNGAFWAVTNFGG